MASRADEAAVEAIAAMGPAAGDTSARRVPPSRLGAAIRASFTDYYFNSMRLVPANVAWGAGLIAIVLVGLVWPLGGLLLLPLLALPTAGIFRLAARIVRVAPDAGRQDILWPYRHAAGPILLLGVGMVVGTVVLGTNLVMGIGQAQPGGWVVATLAGWGLLALWVGALIAWPLVVDPDRDAAPLPAKLRLAGALLFIHPARIAALAITMAVTTTISTILTAALLTVSVSFVALVACRVVYPVADRFEAAVVGERP